MRHQHQLAPHADPDVAGAIGHRGVKQGDIGANRGHQEERIVLPEGIVDHPPVGPVTHQVGADDAAQREEGDALLRGLQAGVDRRAGGIPELDRTGPDGGGEARRRTLLAEGHRGRLDAGRAARADQQIGLEAELRHADQLELPGAAPDQRADHGKRAAGVVRRQRQARAVRDAPGQIVDGDLCRHEMIRRSSRPPPPRSPACGSGAALFGQPV